MPATDAQVQQYVDQRIRVRAEQCRALLNSILDDKASIDDVYAACTQQNPTWIDNRTDGPPHLLVPSDVPNFNALITALITIINGTATANDAANAASIRNAWPVLQKACVRPVGG